ncbi:MAG: phosphoglucosamine mutase [Saprospiraceae bacterium]|nr:phosphoglucosamine mutase [Saprospiraceae bacterium]MDP4820575.1 phosphoglucosamine mutase [Saprospiraceae bacterium]MDP4999021.1 phosphoglucosamine mutase [Saprospiraceae bacterium]
MALIQSISGIRGTIGGKYKENLTPRDIVESVSAFGQWIINRDLPKKVVIGRDGRISGEMVAQLSIQTLRAMGISVLDLGLSTTPTVEMAVTAQNAGAGIIVTASHNPKAWNALKLLDQHGEFISQEAGEALLQLLQDGAIEYASVDALGTYTFLSDALDQHVEAILNHPLVDVEGIRRAGFRVVLDPVNSTGGLAVPLLLEKLGCEWEAIHNDLSGNFAHNPEPLPEHLGDLCTTVVNHGADLGIAVDPDVDRLVLVSEDGSVFGEEYTLVAVADYVLGKRKGNTVSNLSSSRALSDITRKHGGQYFASAVGEVNVVQQMKTVQAVIGGEGNGGVIVPDLHYGRDALAGIALFLSHLAAFGGKMSELRQTYPDYQMVKDKMVLDPAVAVDQLLEQLAHHYRNETCTTIDGLKVDFAHAWVHLRKSNTEPIIRIYAEAPDLEQAQLLVADMKTAMQRFL